MRLRAPTEQDFSSTLRSPRLTSWLGLALAVTFPLCFLTGLISHLVQQPPGWFSWPPGPVWLYRLTQGTHVTSGLISVPLLGIKLWSVAPKFWRRPDSRGPRLNLLLDVAERGTILILIGAAAFELLTGLLNVAEFYAWSFFFPSVHYVVAWVAIGSLALHVAIKLPIVRTALRTPLPSPDPAPTAPGGLSRRGLLATAATASAVIMIATVGDKIPALRGVSVLAQRSGNGPQGLPVNRTAQAARIQPADVGENYRLTVAGPTMIELSLADLGALPQYTATLPITCVEGWSQSAVWTGVRLIDLINLIGGADFTNVRMVSHDRGPYGRSIVSRVLAEHPDTLIALRLNGEILDPDHGYPARLIAPNRPGARQTKWLSRVELITS